MTGAESIRVMHPLIQAEEGGSIPTSALSLRLEPVEFDVAKSLNRKWHSRLPLLGTGAVKRPGKRFTCYAAVHDGLIFAVAIWSLPAARELPQDGTWLELRRLAICNQAPRNTASRMLAVMLRLLRKDKPMTVRVCSSQDTECHTGAIYRAAGWTPASVRPGKAEWSCLSRPRPKSQSAAPKKRWEKSL